MILIFKVESYTKSWKTFVESQKQLIASSLEKFWIKCKSEFDYR